MPISISGSRRGRLSPAMPPPSGGVGVAGAGLPSSPMTFSTNCFAAALASAAGKYTLIVTQAVKASTPASGIPIQRFITNSPRSNRITDEGSLHDRLDLTLAGGGQALQQRGPVDLAIEPHHRQVRNARPFHDSKTRAF